MGARMPLDSKQVVSETVRNGRVEGTEKLTYPTSVYQKRNINLSDNIIRSNRTLITNKSYILLIKRDAKDRLAFGHVQSGDSSGHKLALYTFLPRRPCRGKMFLEELVKKFCDDIEFDYQSNEDYADDNKRRSISEIIRFRRTLMIEPNNSINVKYAIAKMLRGIRIIVD
ncbi:unnamed protein product [Didymodactylos carnosus]|uniref:Uncharacterized protein n=1 Tax=Didymodactylos carnosus TaxID=1234261 RepID=A0A814QPU6_9BILA|nr:unnamed protein product [Didymodactylos carnosus]CAF1528104.1 unnamed protein product [Didymodactylos carnosus]CAF3886149.1 unnamed protein product [Didymodactylos carnosus]CAF4314806.1 unnamed protein product [Didymodactylos carnosus]